MNGKKAKRIRKMIRRFQPSEDVLMGDQRTVRYFYSVPLYDEDGNLYRREIQKSESAKHPDERAVPLFATYTLRYRPGADREMYRRVKRHV